MIAIASQPSTRSGGAHTAAPQLITTAMASMSGVLLIRLSPNSRMSSMSKVRLPEPVEVSFSRASRTRFDSLRRWADDLSWLATGAPGALSSLI